MKGERLISAVREAGALALSYANSPLRSWTKDHSSPVSEADIAVDRLLRARLDTEPAAIGWLSEESEDDPARLRMRRVWVVDPIDGTRAYIAGRPDWSISAALVEDGRPILAALFAPIEDSLLFAAAGEGAMRNGVALAPVRARQGADAGLEGVAVAGPKPLVDSLKRRAPGMVVMPKVHSLALRIARVATGHVDLAFASQNSHDWDLAAADLLVHEAGGALTGFDGAAPVYNRKEPVHGALVAAGRALHHAVLGLLQSRSAA